MGLDAVAADAELHQLVGHGIGALLRQPLVDLGSARLAVSIARQHHAQVVLYGGLGHGGHVLAVALGHDNGLAQVEEDAHRCSYNLRSLSLGGRDWCHLRRSSQLGGQLLLQPVVLGRHVLQLGVQCVNLALRQCLYRFHVGGLRPAVTPYTVGHADLSEELPVARLHRQTAAALIAVQPEVHVCSQLRRQSQRVEQSDAQAAAILLLRRVTEDAATDVGYHVPQAFLLIA